MSALIWSVFADQAQAKTVARTLLQEDLIRCANIVPAVTSVFVWNGHIDEADEIGMVCKTDATRLDRAVARMESLHPYDTPAILGWLVDSAAEATKSWLSDPAIQAE